MTRCSLFRPSSLFIYRRTAGIARCVASGPWSLAYGPWPMAFLGRRRGCVVYIAGSRWGRLESSREHCFTLLEYGHPSYQVRPYVVPPPDRPGSWILYMVKSCWTKFAVQVKSSRVKSLISEIIRLSQLYTEFHVRSFTHDPSATPPPTSSLRAFQNPLP